jgi:hypothetical protein
MGSVRNVDKAFSPLDEELGLLSERLTPHAHACLVRYGAWMPFEKAAQELAFSLKVTVSEPTARRYAQAAGEAYVGWQTQEVERLERETPASPQGAEKLFFSADGAMVPIVGGEWTEVKTMTIGEIAAPVLEQGEWVVHSHQHSYFSRVAEANDFRRLALVESHQRGVEKAKTIAAVTDGAEWEQKFIDFHCPEAVRILDFPHAAERVSGIGQALWENQDEFAATWLTEQLHELKHHGPADLLVELCALRNQHPAVEKLKENLAYLEKREAHMHYPDYQAQGLPIGSGAMESGNKVVVEARLKGAGMHWAVPHINPMLALRNILCSDRWEEAWPQIETSLRQAKRQRKKELRARKPAVCQDTPGQPMDLKPNADPPVRPQPTSSAPSAQSNQFEPRKPHRPAANHPWRRSPIGRAKYSHPTPISKN